MEKEIKIVTPEELKELIKSQRGEFLIRVELGGEEAHGNKGILPA